MICWLINRRWISSRLIETSWTIESRSLKKNLQKKRKSISLMLLRLKETNCRQLKSCVVRCWSKSKWRKLVYFHSMTTSYKQRPASPFCRILSLPSNLSTSQSKLNSYCSRIARCSSKSKPFNVISLSTKKLSLNSLSDHTFVKKLSSVSAQTWKN